MKDFKSFSSGGQGGKGTPDGAGQNNGFEDDKGVKLVQRVAQSMAGKSELDIMKAVITEAERGKREPYGALARRVQANEAEEHYCAAQATVNLF